MIYSLCCLLAAKISIILRLVERRGTQDPILQDMSKELDPVCKKFFAAGSPLSEKYRVEYNSHSKGPYTLVLIKLPGYSRRVFYRDLLNKEIAKAMDTEISQSDFIKRTKKRVNIALDVDIRQLKDVGNSVDQRDGSPSSLTLGATDADEDEDNEGEDEENGMPLLFMNALGPAQNILYFADDIFKMHFLFFLFWLKF